MLVRTVLAENWELALAVRIYPRTSSTVHTMNTQQEKTAKKKKIKKNKNNIGNRSDNRWKRIVKK
jgi:hypothetical protein